MGKRMAKGNSCGLMVHHMKEFSKTICLKAKVLFFLRIKHLITHVGTYKWNDRKEYSGQWRESKMCGKGCYKWPDGRTYNGTFLNDMKDGYGIMTWADGKRYEGYWKNGKMHGKGKIVNPDGKETHGTWEEGRQLEVSGAAAATKSGH